MSKSYRATVDIWYPANGKGDEKHAAAGDVVTDFPDDCVESEIQAGHIEEVKKP